MYNRILEFYIDGTVSTRTDMGGWASVCVEDGVVLDTKYGYEPYTTNNRMELAALSCALENINTIESTPKCTKVIVYTNSTYLCRSFNEKWYLNWMKNGWKTADKRPVKNQEYWTRIVALYIKLQSKLKELVITNVKPETPQHWGEYAEALSIKMKNKLEQMNELIEKKKGR